MTGKLPRRLLRLAILCACMAAPAFAQFALYVVDAGGQHPAPAVLGLGSVYPSESAGVRFRLRNISTASAELDILQVNGVGFTLSGVPALPASLDPQQAVDFTATFQAGAVGSYSASLAAEGVSVLLTAAVLPSLTYQVDAGAGWATLGAPPVDFGAVEAGGGVTRHFLVSNLTARVLTIPAIAIQGDAFVLPQVPPSGAMLEPLQTAAFDVAFQPSAMGAVTASLLIGDRTYTLTGQAAPIPLPRPLLSIDPPLAQSGQQGTVAVMLDAPSRTAGSGTLTLDFQPLAKGATDSAIQLGVVGRSLPFTVAAGDTRAAMGDLASVGFQTGTTAGTLVFTAVLGSLSDRQTLTIDPAPIGLSSAQALRGAGSIELRIAGFDNTRTAGPVSYTFFDAAGNPIPPGAIRVDSTADFAAMFAASDAGGAFLLRAVFPVTGDASRIAAFAVQLTNSAGVSGSGRVPF